MEKVNKKEKQVKGKKKLSKGALVLIISLIIIVLVLTKGACECIIKNVNLY